MKLQQSYLWYTIFFTLQVVCHQVPAPHLRIKQDAIHTFHQQHMRHLQKCYRGRMVFKGGLLLAFMGAFLKEWGTISEVKQKLSSVADQLQTLQTTPSLTNNFTSAPASQASMIFQGIKTSVSASLSTTWSLAKYLIISIASQKCVSALFDPLINPLFTTITLTAADSWFLAEQVSHSQVTFVVVQEEIQLFITLLNRIETTIDQLPLIHHTKDAALLHYTLANALQLIEELIGYMQALTYHVPTHEQPFYRTFLATIQPSMIQSAETFCHEIQNSDATAPTNDITAACAHIKAHVRTLIRPLQHVTPYHILPWPFAVACQEALQSMIATSLGTHIQPVSPA
jgi:hypothetical protein